jgi:hypothetical protein
MKVFRPGSVQQPPLKNNYFVITVHGYSPICRFSLKDEVASVLRSAAAE